MAVAAVVTGDVTFARHPLAQTQSGNALTQSGDLAHIFMTDGHRGLDMLYSPRIPVVDMYIRAAYRSLMHLDQHFTGIRDRHRYPPQFQSGTGYGLYDSVHIFFHLIVSFIVDLFDRQKRMVILRTLLYSLSPQKAR